MPSLLSPLINRLPPAFAALALASLSLALSSCDQDLNSSQDQPTVDYVILATDSATALPLDGVRVRVTTITGDTSSYLTSVGEGRAQIPTVASSRTLFELSRQGYITRDTIDTVNSKPDTVFHRPIPRLLTVRLRKVGETGDGRVQVNVLVRDADLNKLTRATATYEDSLGDKRIVADTAESGTIGLEALKVGTTQVLVKHPGYLGHWFDVTVNNLSDTGHTPSQVAILGALGANSISGQVFQTTGSGNQPLQNARVEFRLNDSLAVPDTFVAFTSGDRTRLGYFEMDSVPALDGQILYFKDRTSTEPVKTVPILKAQVALDGPLAPMTLTIASDSSLPYLTKAPGDSVRPNDSLVFQCNQKVTAVDRYQVQLINQSELLVDTAWNGAHTELRLWLKDGRWTPGKQYQYELSLRNVSGQYFTAQGDTQTTIVGVFAVPDSVGPSASVRLPKNFAFPYFNSGNYFLFDGADSNSCPFPDSTNQFARLRWQWASDTGNKVDSLLVYYQDGGITADNWALWGTYPGAADSATLVFADHYSTTLEPNLNKRLLPFKTGGQIRFRIVPKHEGKTYPDSVLPALAQGMGLSVYSSFAKGSSVLKVHANDTDSVFVTFQTSPTDVNSVVNWGGSPPTPIVSLNDKIDSSSAKWVRWKEDGKTGVVRYILPSSVDGFPVIRVDLDGILVGGKPIWHRNRRLGFVVQ